MIYSLTNVIATCIAIVIVIVIVIKSTGTVLLLTFDVCDISPCIHKS